MLYFKSLANKISRILASIVLMTAQMTPFFVFNAQLAAASPIVGGVPCTVDTLGADDEPGQKDLTQMCASAVIFDVSTGNSMGVYWGWDDTSFPGANTGDACALLDTDGNGLSDFAACVTIEGNPAAQQSGSPRYYNCNDTSSTNCLGATAIVLPASPITTCSVVQNTTNPFNSGSDTNAICVLVFNELGLPATTSLVEVCSYPSQSLTSSASDCVVNTGNKARVEIVKDLIPSANPGLFNLKVDGTTHASAVGDGGTTGEIIVDSGSIVVSETAVSPTSLADYDTTITCTDGNGSGQVVATGNPTGASSRQKTFTIAASSDVVCVFTNELKTGELVVEKVLSQQWGGTEVASDFSFIVDGHNSNQPIAFEADGSNTLTLPLGTYSVSEVDADGYVATYSNCGGIALVEGQPQTCVITNTDQPATLTVVKDLITDNGSPAVNSDFSFSVNGATPATFEADGSNELTVPAGTYNIVETDATGFTTTYANCSNVVLGNGESATCTITNDDQAGTLIVKKVLTQDNGGLDPVTSFGFSINSGNSVGFEADAENVFSVNNGTYSVVEDLAQGYTTTYDNCEAVLVTNGSTVTCTITNDDQPGLVTIYKEVINNFGGPLEIDDFVLFVSGDSGTTYVTSGLQIMLNAGTYTVGEDDALPAYLLASIAGDCSDSGTLTVALGGTYSCTLTNEDQPAKIRVHKSVTNDDGGLLDAENFQFTVNDLDQQNFEEEGEYVELVVSAGTYTIEEVATAGYAVTYDNCESIQALNGVVYNCYVSNDDQPATLHVVKELITDHGSPAVSSNFSFSVNGEASIEFENDQTNTLTVPAGTYSVVEDDAQGFTTTYENCSDVVVSNGGEATCTVTNDDQPGIIWVHKTLTQDNGGTAMPSDFSFTTSANPNTDIPFNDNEFPTQLGVSYGTYTITENDASGYTTSYDNCQNIEVLNGQEYHCYITNDDQPAIIDVVKLADPCDTDQVFTFDVIQDGQTVDTLERSPACHDYEDMDYLMSAVIQPMPYTNGVEVDAGEVTVTENVPDNWFQNGTFCYYQDGEFRQYFAHDNGTFEVENGVHYTCEFNNTEYGELVVTKFHDYNEDGKWDENEPVLENWEMCEVYLSDSPPVEDACNPGDFPNEGWANRGFTNEDGDAVFDEILPGAHSVAEVLQDGWTQSNLWCEVPEWRISEMQRAVSGESDQDMDANRPTNVAFVPAGETTYCYVGNFRQPLVEIEKTNDTIGPVQRGTEVTFTLTVKVPEVSMSGALRGAMDGADYLPVTVTDFLTDEFDYVPGSFSAESSERGDLVAAGITTDPNYASPGSWILTSQASNTIIPGEIITLVYRAIVGSTTIAGTYPTTASVIGYGNVVTVTASATDDNQVIVSVPAVLGATTTPVLASTGQGQYLPMLVGLQLVWTVVFVTKRRPETVSTK